MQLHTLRPRLGVGDDVVWVTPRTPQTESLLAGERVHWALPCPPRDTRALARNALAVPPPLRRARRLAGRQHRRGPRSRGAAAGATARHRDGLHRERDPAGRAVPLGARAGDGAGHHDLQPVQRPGARPLAVPRLAVGALRDGTPADERPVRSMVVSLGTQEDYGFRRLLDRLVPLVPAGAEVLWQTGGTDTTGLGIDGRERVPSEEMARRDPRGRRRGGARRDRHRADGPGERQVPHPGAPPRDAR